MRTTENATALGVAVLAVASAVALATLSFIGNKTPTTVTDPTGSKLEGQPVAQIARQGWGFFTRDAREDILNVSVSSNGQWQELTMNRMSSVENAFGFSRRARAVEQDIAAIVEQPEIAGGWRECPRFAEVNDCIAAQDDEPVLVRLNPVDEDFCGPLLLTRTPPVPISFAKFDVDPPIRYVTVEVAC